MAKNKNLWIIAGIIIMTIIIMQGDVKKTSTHYDTSSSACEADKSDKAGYPCLTSCQLISSTVEACARGVGYTSWDDNIGEYAYIYSSSESCMTYFANQIATNPIGQQAAAVNCVSAWAQYKPAPVSQINPADSNSDHIITLSEVITYANLWVNNQGVTLSQVMIPANIWANGGTY